MFPTISINSLHLEYQLWINELNFAKEEINIFEKYLGEIVCKNTSKETLKRGEHFQNSFISQKEVIDVLKHNLHISEKQLATYAHKLSGDSLETVKMDNHSKLREDVHLFRDIYSDLKKQFREFEGEWL